MKVIVNYPDDEETIELLKERIDEFKAFLVVESINRLNITLEDKKKIMNKIIEGLESGKYSA